MVCWRGNPKSVFHITVLVQGYEELLLLFGAELLMKSSGTWDPHSLIPFDNLPFKVTVVFKLSYNKDKIVNIKVNTNSLFNISLAFRNELN